MGAMIALAFVVYGGWAVAVNLEHGIEIAVTAGLAQGVSSSISTLIISAVIEYCYSKFQGHRMGLLLAWLIPPTLTGFMHAVFQLIVGTPDIIETVSFSVVMGYAFGGIYVRGLIKIKQVLGEDPDPAEIESTNS